MIVWGNPAALLGMLVLTGPVVAHLLRRQRADRLPFPSLRFIVPSQLASVRLRLPSDLLLLFVRLAIVALAVAALAQPLVLTASRLEAWNLRTARAVVVDASESMRRTAEAAAQAVRDASVAAGGESTATRIDEADLRAGLLRAVASLTSGAPARREIVVISDFQIGSLTRGDLDVVPPSIGLRFVQVGSFPAESRFGGMSLFGLPRGQTPAVPATGVRPQSSQRLGSDPSGWFTHSGSDDARTQEIVLTGPATGISVTRRAASSDGLTLVGADASGEAVSALVRAVAAAGAPAPSAEQPLIVRFTGGQLAGAIQAISAGWVLDTVLRLRRDEEVARAARDADASDERAAERPWFIVCRDRQRRPLVRAAADGRALLLDVAADPSAFLSAAVVRAALMARNGPTAQPEQEIRRIPGSDLTRWSRPPLPVTADAGLTSGMTDARWCWALVLLTLGAETAMRRTSRVSRQEARADAA